MKKYLDISLARLQASVRSLAQRLFSRKEVRSTLVAAALASFAPLASAVDLTQLGPANDIVCLISSYVSGPWLFAIGVILIIVGAIAISNSESSMGKFAASVLVGVGLAAAAIPVAKNVLHLNYVCA